MYNSVYTVIVIVKHLVALLLVKHNAFFRLRLNLHISVVHLFGCTVTIIEMASMTTQRQRQQHHHTMHTKITAYSQSLSPRSSMCVRKWYDVESQAKPCYAILRCAIPFVCKLKSTQISVLT